MRLGNNFKKLSILFFAVQGLFGCGSKENEKPDEVPNAEVIQASKIKFTVEQEQNLGIVDAGSKIILKWEIPESITQKCNLSANDSVIESGVFKVWTKTVFPAVTTKYKLSCGKDVEAEVTVKVHPESKISEFVVSPTSFNAGDKISIKADAFNVKSCNILANDAEIHKNIKLNTEYTDHPIKDTVYSLQCETLGGKKLEKAIPTNLIIKEVSLNSDKLSQINQWFNLYDVFYVAKDYLNEHQIKTEYFTDFHSNYDQSFLKRPENRWEHLEADRKIEFSQKNSVLYGLESGHDFVQYNKSCVEAYDKAISLNTLKDDESVIYSDRIDEPTDIKTLIPENQYHIKDFKAVPKYNESPIKKGSQVKIDYKISQTHIIYEQKYTEHGTAKGKLSLNVDGNKLSEKLIKSEADDRDRDYCETFGDPYCAGDSTFPKYYPIPKSTTQYKYDPKDAVCSMNDSVRVRFEMEFASGENGVEEYCFNVPNDDWCWSEYGSQPLGWPWITITIDREFNTLDYYDRGSIQSSKRVTAESGNIKCGEQFPEYISSLGINSNLWNVTYSKVQKFQNDSTWPSCGSNCTKVDRISERDDRFSNVEPFKNKCIDRWSGVESWTSYRQNLLTTCKNSKVYTDALLAYQIREELAALLKACNNDASCTKGVSILKTYGKKLKLQKEFDENVKNISIELEEAKKLGKSFLISKNDQIYKDSSLIEEFLATGIKNYFGEITTIHMRYANRILFADYLKHIVGFDLNEEFNSLSNSVNLFAKYQENLDTLKNEIYRVIVAKNICEFSQNGRFVKYAEPVLREIKNVEIEQSFSGNVQAIEDIRTN